ncbi:MAG: tryptophan synthase subunit alpha [Proteobacteria bacterium]|nr:tryptophan synthase subunit alpha [Pseudomonadota bacterium]
MTEADSTFGAGRIAQQFEALRSQGKKALVTFVTAGDPGLDFTVPAMHSLVAGGANLLELGIPFSDPEAEGPAIQAANERALANGMTLAKVLDMVAEFRQTDSVTPVILMGYLNSVLAMADFPQRASQAGVDGLIMVNLPLEEGAELQRALKAVNIDVVWLVAPTTSDARARDVASNASGFLYYVSLKGTTGSGSLAVDEVAERTRYLRTLTDVPLCVGFGIKDAETARAVSEHADGVIVGSALVQLMADSADVPAATARLRAATGAIRQGIDA